MKINPLKESELTEQGSIDSDPDSKLEKIHKQQESGFFHWVKIIFMGLVVVLAGILIVTYFLHLVTPRSWHWLDTNQLGSLKDQFLSIVSGVVVGVVITYIKEK